jgi:hypothetical protein
MEDSTTTPPEQPPRRSTANKILLVGCAGLGAVGLLALAAVSALVLIVVITPDGGSDGGGADAPAAMTCEMDKPCDLGPGTVTITKAKQDDLLTRPTNHRYKGNFVVVQFDYVYDGDSPGEASGYDAWKLEDSEGRTYSHSLDRTVDHDVAWNRNLYYSEVNPGVKYEGVVIFEATPGAEDFTLNITDLVEEKTSKRAEVAL